MKHEVSSHFATYMVEDNPGLRTSGNEGQPFFGQNPLPRREFIKKTSNIFLVQT
ncbi:MAG TPA: hypothetical protein VFD45_03125 [Patescibacteria group bacterium]|nr:hypothetical protein [Patescibacteria group bacterium]